MPGGRGASCAAMYESTAMAFETDRMRVGWRVVATVDRDGTTSTIGVKAPHREVLAISVEPPVGSLARMPREEDRVANSFQTCLLRGMPRRDDPPAVSSDTIEAGRGY